MRHKTLLALSTLTLASLAATAQAQAPGSSASAAYVGMRDAELDAGGKASLDSVQASFSYIRALSAGSTLGIQARIERDSWTFDGANKFGGPLWGDVDRYGIGIPFSTGVGNGWQMLVTPRVEWAMEDGADQGEALSWGLTGGVFKSFGPNKRLGFGLAGFSSIDDDTQLFPFMIVDWRFNDQWRLFNPLGLGPTGPAGLELAYRINEQWEIGGGAAWRNSRFRLASNNARAANGIGEVSSVPVFLHLAWKPTPMVAIDAYAAMAMAGKMTLQNQAGNDIASDDLDNTPVIGISASLRF